MQGNGQGKQGQGKQRQGKQGQGQSMGTDKASKGLVLLNCLLIKGWEAVWEGKGATRFKKKSWAKMIQGNWG